MKKTDKRISDLEKVNDTSQAALEKNIAQFQAAGKAFFPLYKPDLLAQLQINQKEEKEDTMAMTHGGHMPLMKDWIEYDNGEKELRRRLAKVKEDWEKEYM